MGTAARLVRARLALVRLALALLLPLLLAPAGARAHGGQPRIRQLSFPSQFPDLVFAVTDTQGLYLGGRDGGDFRWLCEDGIAPFAGVRLAVPLGVGQTRWLVASDEALFITHDRGCSFGPLVDTPEMAAAGGLSAQRASAISVAPGAPQRALLATDGFGRPNDVWRTEDGGDTWQPAGLALVGGIQALVRAEADPTVIFVAHSEGALLSLDEGRTFSPIKLGPAGTDVRPEEFRLLATHPTDPQVVFAAAERFPDTLLMRSADQGASWTVVDAIPDFPLQMVFAADGVEALVVSPFEGLRRSRDGGRTFAPEALPVARLGCLTRAPGEAGALFGCSDVFFGGPWVVGRSDDFGRTWRPLLAAYTDSVGAWTCTREAPARACCQHLCPGLAAGADCPGRAPAPGPTCPFAAELQLDGGLPDGGPDPDGGGAGGDGAGGDGAGGGGAGGGGAGGGGAGGGGAGGAGGGGAGGGGPGDLDAGPGPKPGARDDGCAQAPGGPPDDAPALPLAWALGIGYCVSRTSRTRRTRRTQRGPLC